MTEKPTTAAGYEDGQTGFVRATCLYVATKLGDMMDDLVVVGGLVPSLLIDQGTLPTGSDPHVGTRDLDLGITVDLLNDGRYHTLTERLRHAKFEPDVSDHDNPTLQRWTIQGPETVTVDFLISPSRPEDRGGRLRNIERDFAAVITPGLHLAFEDRRRATLEGRTIRGEKAARDVWICGPGAYVVLKSLALRERGENKDAYDLYYVVRNYGTTIDDVASSLKSLLHDSSAEEALSILEQDFREHDGIGPRRTAEFLTNGPDDEIQADVVGFVRQLLERCR